MHIQSQDTMMVHQKAKDMESKGGIAAHTFFLTERICHVQANCFTSMFSLKVQKWTEEVRRSYNITTALCLCLRFCIER